MTNLWALLQMFFPSHDGWIVVLVLAVCALGCVAATAMASRARRLESVSSRRNWLALAGLVTGLAVWTTQFLALLGFRSDLDIRYDLAAAAISILACGTITTAAWLIGYLQRERGALAGAMIGVAIVTGHTIGLHTLSVAGTIRQDPLTSAAAVALGMGLSILSGLLFQRRKGPLFAWLSAALLSSAILSVHFVAVSGISVSPGAALTLPYWSAPATGLPALIVGAFLCTLAALAVLALQSILAFVAAAKERRLLSRALRALGETRAHYRAYVEVSPQIGWVANPRGNVIEIAPLWTEVVGLPGEDALDDGWISAIHPEDVPLVLQNWRKAVETGDEKRANSRYRMRLGDGSYKWYQIRARPRRKDPAGPIIAWYGSMEDIEDQVAAETALRTSEERFRLASCATNDVIWDWSVEQQRAIWAGDYARVLGYPELSDGSDRAWWLDRIHPDDSARLFASQRETITAGDEYWHDEYRFRAASGDWLDIKSCCIIVRNKAGDYVRMVSSMADITGQKRARKKLVWAAYHDSLTGLANRAQYLSDIAAATAAARSAGRHVALVLLDLNRFKTLNDTLGHSVGDAVLREIAHRLSETAPPGASVARLGGDEFAVVLPELATEDCSQELVARLKLSLAEPVAFDDMNIAIAFCAGVAIFPRDGKDPSELLHAADLALYAAKEKSPGTVFEFSPALRTDAEERTAMLLTARTALDSDGIVPFYQPKIDLHTGQIDGWEALLRIDVGGATFLHPAVISAAFDDAEISVQITERMLSRVFADIARWGAAGFDPGQIAINVSAGDLRQAGLTERIQFHAAAHGQSVSRIGIEITENVLIGRSGPEISRMVEELRELGVEVALDDFGTGYASLTHLQRFPVDVIKLDRSFVEQIDETAPKTTAVIDAMLQMARLLGIRTVAEGVENARQARYLRARGCTGGQGYLFSHPIAFAEVQDLMARQPLEHWQFVTVDQRRRRRIRPLRIDAMQEKVSL